METNQGTGDAGTQRTDGGMASATLKKVSKKIIDAAPNEGPVADAAVRVAGSIEAAGERIKDFDASRIGPALRSLPWGVIGGVALAAGGVALALSKPVRRSVVGRVDDLFDTNFAGTPAARVGKGRAKAKGSKTAKARAH